MLLPDGLHLHMAIAWCWEGIAIDTTLSDCTEMPDEAQIVRHFQVFFASHSPLKLGIDSIGLQLIVIVLAVGSH
jgi:hypothetical protein